VHLRPDGYARRRPEETALHRVVRRAWPRFRERCEEVSGGGLPRFVRREVEGYLRCGLLEHGCVRLACAGCGEALVVAFSCKARGFCPSCVARRMADAAAHLVEEVLPEVPIRQWVCTLPWAVRKAAGYKRAFCTELIEAFTGVLSGELRRRAKRAFGLRSAGEAHGGLVVFVQRSDGALRLNVHLHVLALDGVYVRNADGTLEFRVLQPPTREEVHRVAERMHGRLERLCAKHGVAGMAGTAGDEHGDGCAEEESQTALAVCMEAASRDVSLFGERAGERTEKRRVAVRSLEGRGASPFVGEHGGVNVHAGVAVHGRDRAGLERLCRYVTRPPIALERLTERDDGRVEYAFRKPWRDGTRAVVLTGEDLVARLCAMVPPPRFHLTRYAGVLAPNAKLRSEVVPGRARDEAEAEGDACVDAKQGELFGGEAAANDGENAEETRSSRHPWAWLLRRVFAVEVLVCVHCAGKLRIVEIATEPEATKRIARDERRRRGEPVGHASTLEARGPPGQLAFTFR
jgi:hypothetical protein